MLISIKNILLGLFIIIISIAVIQFINKKKNKNKYTPIKKVSNPTPQSAIKTTSITEIDLEIDLESKLESKLESNSKFKPSQLNFVTSLNRKKQLDNPTDYYIKKKEC